MRMSNPALRTCMRNVKRNEVVAGEDLATHRGVAGKSIFFALVTIVSAVASVLLLIYSLNRENETLLLGLLLGAGACLVVMLVLSFVIMFAPGAVKVLGTIYSICQGTLLGLVTFVIDTVLPGVPFAAVLGTMVVFVVTVLLSKFFSVRVKGGFMRIFLVAFLSLLAVELVFGIASIFMDPESAMRANFWLQLVVTAGCVLYAAVMLMWDLQSADEIVNYGASKKYEWVVAFSLVTALVYLYIELLELIIRLMAVFGKNK